jgi:hypothetical protein
MLGLRLEGEEHGNPLLAIAKVNQQSSILPNTIFLDSNRSP